MVDIPQYLQQAAYITLNAALISGSIAAAGISVANFIQSGRMLRKAEESARSRGDCLEMALEGIHYNNRGVLQTYTPESRSALIIAEGIRRGYDEATGTNLSLLGTPDAPNFIPPLEPDERALYRDAFQTARIWSDVKTLGHNAPDLVSRISMFLERNRGSYSWGNRD